MNNIKPIEKKYFECACFSSEHTLKFVFDEEYGDLTTEIFLNDYRNVFKRIWTAVKYVFGYKCRYGHWDCWIMLPEDASAMRDLLDRFEEFHKKKEK